MVILVLTANEQPLVDFNTGEVVIFPDIEVANAWKKLNDCEAAYSVRRARPLSSGDERKCRHAMADEKNARIREHST